LNGSSTAIPTSQEVSRCAADWTALLLAVVAFLVCRQLTQRSVDGWDPLAYLYAAERMADGEPLAYCHTYNEEIGPYFTLAGFNVRGAEPGCLYLNYPPGFPLVLAAAQKLIPLPDAMYVVPALFGATGLLVTYALGRLWLDVRSALTAMVILMLTPVYLQFSTSVWSDLPVTVMLFGGLALLVWAERQPSAKLQKGCAFVAGLVIGWGLFGRYSAAVFLAPVAVHLIGGKSISSLIKSPVVWGFSLSVALVFFGIATYNRVSYGGALMTPYSVEHGWYDWPKFSLHYALGQSPVGSGSLVAEVQTLRETFGYLLLVAAIGVGATPRRARWVVLTGLGCFLVFYGLYAFPARGINARFVLPMLPFVAFLVAAGLWRATQGRARITWIWRGIVSILLVTQFVLSLPGTVQKLRDRNLSAKVYVEQIAAVVGMTEPNAVVLAYYANDPIAYHGERLTLFYRRMQPPTGMTDAVDANFEHQLVYAVKSLLDRGVPVYYMLDMEPSFRDSLAILERNFEVRSVTTDAQLYSIARLGDASTSGESLN
jgi:4-amino-4-deoxy-L-arabinose transferase-like glycosyltransferase